MKDTMASLPARHSRSSYRPSSTLCVVVTLLLTNHCCANIDTRLGGVITNSVHRTSLLETLQHSTARRHLPIKRADLQTHINGLTSVQTGVQKPSVGFMVNVFEHLLDGQDMSTALGHTDARTKDRMIKSDTIRSFTATRESEGEFEFQVPALPNHEQVIMAELRFLDNYSTRRRRRLTMRVQKDHVTLVKQKMYTTTETKSKAFSISTTSIINYYKGNMTIRMSLRKSDLAREEVDFTESVPILVLYSTDVGFMKSALQTIRSADSGTNSDVSSSRVKRQAGSSTSNSSRKKGRKRRKDRWRNRNTSEVEICRMHNFKVDFDLIGWGPWIIHPKTYNARVCYGQCPSPITKEYTPTNHAMLQTLMKMRRPLSAPEPCCVPTKLRPLSMLYFEYEDIVVRHHQDMIVGECGCR